MGKKILIITGDAGESYETLYAKHRLMEAGYVPVIASTRTTKGRADAHVYFVFDVSRSMSARASASGPTRLDRARRDGEALRSLLPVRIEAGEKTPAR